MGRPPILDHAMTPYERQKRRIELREEKIAALEAEVDRLTKALARSQALARRLQAKLDAKELTSSPTSGRPHRAQGRS